MELVGKARRVRIYVSEGDLIGHRPAHVALVEFLRGQNAAGATVIKAVAGFGGSGQIYSSAMVDLQGSLPLIVEWIDMPERVARLLPRIVELVGQGLVTVEDTELALYNPHPIRDVSGRIAVAEVMSRDVVTVNRATPIRQVVELMLGKIYRAVVVAEAGRPIGIITNSDLVARGGLAVRMELLPRLGTVELSDQYAQLERNHKTAGDVMTPDPVTVAASATLPQVAELMAQRRLKRLPVVDDAGLICGVVSRLDLLRTVAGGFERAETEAKATGLAGDQPVARAMRADVPTVFPDTPLPEVMQAIVSTRLNRALVVDAERRVVGVVTDEQLLERVTPALRPSALRSLMNRLPFVNPSAEAQHAQARVAADLMDARVAAVRVDAPLRDAVAAMLSGAHKLVAVVDGDDRLVGVVDRADIMRVLLGPGNG